MGSARESALVPRDTIRNHAAFIWSVADLLRGDYKQSEYGKVILPLTVIRRLDCVLEPTKAAVLSRHNQLAGRIENLEPVLQAAAGDLPFYNTSPLTFTKLLDDPSTIADSLSLYVGFDYLLANPPFGVEWKKVEDAVKAEAQTKGFSGRFGAGFPRINDGSFLFLQHMISKMKRPQDGGSRLAIVINGSPLFTGAAGSGESEIRRWIIENDWLEAVVALPDQLFYNTGISTYFWIVTNRKSPERRGKVQLIDARELFVKTRKSLGEKRNEISTDQIAEITRLYGEFQEGEKVKILPNEAFGFLRITVEQPLRLRWEITDETIQVTLEAKALLKQPEQVRDLLRELLAERLGSTFENQKEIVKALGPRIIGAGLPAPAQNAIWSALAVRDPAAPIVADRKGNAEPDSDLRDEENVPLPPLPVSYEEDPTARLTTLEYRAAIDDYVRDEVLPYLPESWVDHEKTKIGYDIPLSRHFYKYVPPRPLAEIDAEIRELEDNIQQLLGEVAG